jgi:catechol 2,3-dioxygenase-like lactoylglutathione lyase family enzyme
MLTGVTALIDRFDHFVVPVDDIVAAEEFYTSVLGGRIAVGRDAKPMRLGLNLAQAAAGLAPHTFFELAGRRIGVYLQTAEREPPNGVHGAPTYSFEGSSKSLNRIAVNLARIGFPHDGPDEDTSPVATRSLFFNDPAGNHYHVYVPRDSSDPNPSDELHRVGYLRLEAGNFERAVAFYSALFGFRPEVGTNPKLGAREATLRLPSGQLFLLLDAPVTFKGVRPGWNVPGPHLAFTTAEGQWETLRRGLDELGVDHGDVAEETKGRSPRDRATYFCDPAGYRIQLVGWV